MAIFKAEVEINYTQLPNETIQDNDLSWEASGLLHFLLSLPAKWEIHKDWVQKQKKGCGRDKLTRMFKELQDAGYMRKVAKREGARLKGWDWYVYPNKNTELLKTRSSENNTPKNTEQLKFSSSEIQCDGKPATIKETDLIKETLEETIVSPKARQDKKYPEEFEWLWKRKPERLGTNSKTDAYKKINARIKEGSTMRSLTESLMAYKKFKHAEGKLGTSGVMMVSTFFGPGLHFETDWNAEYEKLMNNERSKPKYSTLHDQVEEERAKFRAMGYDV